MLLANKRSTSKLSLNGQEKLMAKKRKACAEDVAIVWPFNEKGNQGSKLCETRILAACTMLPNPRLNLTILILQEQLTKQT